MRLTITQSHRFKKSYKRVSRTRSFKREIFVFVVETISRKEQLDQKYHDHALTGDMLGYRECHLAPDILLIYEVRDDLLLLTLINIGNHAQLF